MSVLPKYSPQIDSLKIDAFFKSANFIELNKNGEFNSVFINSEENITTVNKPFIGLDLNSFEFVEGETTETLERSMIMVTH